MDKKELKQILAGLTIVSLVGLGGGSLPAVVHAGSG
ncbi:MAG: SbtA family thio(seleno)oxazole RiPP natural product precursor [Thermodesulfobacteriota bacterium]